MSAVAVPGVVTIAPRAQTRAARALVSEVLGAPVADVGVRVHGAVDGIALSITTTLPLATSQPLGVHLQTTRRTIAERFEKLTGRHVALIDLRVDGVAASAPRRVR